MAKSSVFVYLLLVSLLDLSYFFINFLMDFRFRGIHFCYKQYIGMNWIWVGLFKSWNYLSNTPSTCSFMFFWLH